MLTINKLRNIKRCTTYSPHRVKPPATQPSLWAIDHIDYCGHCLWEIEAVILEERAGEFVRTLKEDIKSLVGEGVHVMFRKGFPNDDWAHTAWCGIDNLHSKKWMETLNYFVVNPVMSTVGEVVVAQRRIIRALQRELREVRRENRKLRAKGHVNAK